MTSRAGLTELPASIGLCVSLAELDLARASRRPTFFFPDARARATAAGELERERERERESPFFRRGHERSSSRRHNDLTTLPAEFSQLTRLEILFVLGLAFSASRVLG